MTHCTAMHITFVHIISFTTMLCVALCPSVCLKCSSAGSSSSGYSLSSCALEIGDKRFGWWTPSEQFWLWRTTVCPGRCTEPRSEWHFVDVNYANASDWPLTASTRLPKILLKGYWNCYWARHCCRLSALMPQSACVRCWHQRQQGSALLCLHQQSGSQAAQHQNNLAGFIFVLALI